MKRPTINLARALRKNKNCYGFVWRFSNGKFGYQNDNDLGLDLTELGSEQPYIKKIHLRPNQPEYVYQLIGGWEDDGTGVPLTTTKALLLQCHCDELTKREKRLCTNYWRRFINEN